MGTFKWLSRRKQAHRNERMETSASLSEFMTLKHCFEDMEHLRFKLRIFGISIADNEEATHVLRDNKSVVTNENGGIIVE